jgi:phage portal protein BeeE
MSYLVEIEDAFTSLLPGRQYVKFNIDALLRADTLTRYTAHKIAIDAGFMTQQEVRIVENLAPDPQEGVLNV